MKFKILTAVIIFYGSISYAQVTPDTLIININDYGQMCISSFNIFYKHKKTESIDSLFEDFYYDYKISEEKIESGTPVDVFHSIDGELRKILIKKREELPDVIYLKGKKKQIVKSYPVRIHIPKHFPKTEKVTISVKDEKYLDEIFKINLDSMRYSALNDLEKEIKNEKHRKRLSHSGFYQSLDNKINTESRIILQKNANNYICISPIIGIRMLDGEFGEPAPLVGADAGIVLTRKQFAKYRVGVMLEAIIEYPYGNENSVIRGSAYFGLNNSSKNRNEMRWGFSILDILTEEDEEEILYGIFFQHNIRKFGVRLNINASEDDLKNIFNNIEQPDGYYNKRGMTITFYFNF